MEVNITGIKCDTKGCEYRDDSVQFEHYHAYINKPCPDCGANLLTQKDFNDCLNIYKTVTTLNKLNSVFKWFNPFHYWRLIFGDKRNTATLTINYPNQK